MAWNEPGGDKRNPWNRPPKSGGDLDEIVRNLQRRLASLFGRSGGNGSGKSSGVSFGLGSVGVVLALIWLASGMYNVDAQERGVVLRFGRHVETTIPGFHWHIPWPVEQVITVNVSRQYSVTDEASMLTSDTNLVEVTSAVQYIQPDPIKVLFSVRGIEDTLKQVSESAMREAVGQASLDQALAFNSSITDRAKVVLQRTLDSYDTGIRILSVNLTDVGVPEPVQQAQQDAIKATKDKDRFQQEAELYRNNVLPRARGQASIEIQSAQAYRQQQVALAQGETARFNKVFAQYQRAPAVTRERMYIETWEQVYGNSHKVVVATKSGNGQMLYLPLDKLIERSKGALPTDTAPKAPDSIGSDEAARQGSR
jgi:modulator of FtsH protease HflK